MRRWIERRFTALRDPQAVELFGPPQVRAGVRVSQTTAMTYSAVYNAVTILSGIVAALPWHLYRRSDDGGKVRADDYPLYSLLHDSPNPLMTSFQWRESLMWHLLLWGNAYAEIQRRDGHVVALWPIAPWLVTPEYDEKRKIMVYSIANPSGKAARLRQDQILHIAGPGWDGLVGLSIIGLARESLGLGMAAEQFGAQFFGNGANMSGVLEHPGELSDEARDGLRKEWKELYSGLDNSHRIAVLQEGMKYQRVGIPPEDAQFLQTREFQVEEVARWFNLPPHMLKDLRRATFSNIEHQDIQLVKYTLLPWLRRIEQACKLRLLGGEDERTLFSEFNVDGLLRGDTESRYKAYAIGRQWGWLSANRILAMENMDPIGEQGDVYLVPLNMIPADQVYQLNAGGDDEGRSTIHSSRLVRAYQHLLKDAAQRIIRREVQDVRRQAGKLLPHGQLDQFREWLKTYYAEHRRYVERDLTAPLLSLAESVGVLRPDDAASGKARALAKEWAERAVQELAACLDSDHPETSLDERLAGWDDWPATFAVDEAPRVAREFLARAQMEAGGVASGY